MEPLMRCRDCQLIFREMAEDEIDGLSLNSCPGCGAPPDVVDEAPDHFEMAWFWEMVQNAFSFAERIFLRAVADTDEKSPGA